MHPFRFGVQITGLPLPGWRERVRWYEELGFSCIHTPDHVEMRQWDPLTTQAAVAGVTTSAGLSATVLDIGFYHPLVLARAAATVAPLAAGGYELGLGAGWMPRDYELAGLQFDRAGVRLERLEEAVQIIRSLWTNEETTFEGRHYRIDRAPSVLPLPLPVMPKVLLGATQPRATRLAAAVADIVSVFPPTGEQIGWPGWAANSRIEHVAQQMTWAREGAERAGRDFETLELSTQIPHTAVADDPSSLQVFVAKNTEVTPAAQDESTIFLTGTPTQARERLERRREATGVSYYVIFDPSFNYATPEGSPVLPGDSGEGAAERYFQALSEGVLKPLAGQ
ncbi:MAG TPA: LLM class flavin-dependent oxidoreductase [Solirubrobacteraceae bacterium]|jgi:probable F420-dependent oxidoreductase